MNIYEMTTAFILFYFWQELAGPHCSTRPRGREGKEGFMAKSGDVSSFPRNLKLSVPAADNAGVRALLSK